MILYASCVMLVTSALTSLVCNLALLRRLASSIRVAASRVQFVRVRELPTHNKLEVQKARETTLLKMYNEQMNEGKKYVLIKRKQVSLLLS